MKTYFTSALTSDGTKAVELSTGGSDASKVRTKFKQAGYTSIATVEHDLDIKRTGVEALNKILTELL